MGGNGDQASVLSATESRSQYEYRRSVGRLGQESEANRGDAFVVGPTVKHSRQTTQPGRRAAWVIDIQACIPGKIETANLRPERSVDRKSG